MTCRDLITFLHRYLEDDLSVEEQDRFNEHLAICPDCVAYINNYQATVRLAKATLLHDEDPVPDDVPEDLVTAILSVRKTQP